MGQKRTFPSSTFALGAVLVRAVDAVVVSVGPAMRLLRILLGFTAGVWVGTEMLAALRGRSRAPAEDTKRGQRHPDSDREHQDARNELEPECGLVRSET